MHETWTVLCFSALSRNTMRNLHFKARIILSTFGLDYDERANRPKSITSCTFCLKGASNVAYVSDVSLQLRCTQVIQHRELFSGL